MSDQAPRWARTNGLPGGFQKNPAWWPSGEQLRSRSQGAVVTGNSPVPVRNSHKAHTPLAVPSSVRALPRPRRAPSPRDDLANRFRRLAERWRKDTEFHSSANALFMHPAYQEIIGLGRDALPLILTDLARTHSDWFWALRAITGENPVSKEERGYVNKMAERWLEWGREHGYDTGRAL